LTTDETRKNVAAVWARLLEAERPDYVLTITDGPEGDVLYRTPVQRRAVPERAKAVSVSAPTLDAPRPPTPDAIEVVLTLSLSQYSEFEGHLEGVHKRLGMPPTASNTEIILEALRRQAHGDINFAGDGRGQGTVVDQARVSASAADIHADDREARASSSASGGPEPLSHERSGSRVEARKRRAGARVGEGA
jgi:hypothetical protein